MKFKVGEKVRIVKSKHRAFNRYVGKVVEISEIDTFGPFPYRINEADRTYWCDEELELVVEPRFKVGDRVKVREGAWGGKVGVVVPNVAPWGGYDTVVDFGGRDDVWGFANDELELVPVNVPRHTFVKPSPVDAITPETLDRWVDEGVKNVEAQKTLGYEHPSYTIASGDTLLRIENGRAYLYRLEGEKNV